jgi:hypothetical protein
MLQSRRYSRDGSELPTGTLGADPWPGRHPTVHTRWNLPARARVPPPRRACKCRVTGDWQSAALRDEG